MQKKCANIFANIAQPGKKQFWREMALLILLMLLCGGEGLLLGQDVNWDLLNYHLYNPYALLTGRFYTDLMPAGIHTFFNPLLDVPVYLAVKYLNNFPKLVTFLFSSTAGIFIFFVYKTALLFFPQKEDRLLGLFATAIGCSGGMFVSQIGLSTHEVTVSILLAGACYLIFQFITRTQSSLKKIALAGVLLGAAVGLKYTAAPVALGLVCGLVVQWKKFMAPTRVLGILVGSALVGFLVTNGYFITRLWVMYQNPVFPFFNGIFHSPYFMAENWTDTRFFPTTWTQWIFFPSSWLVNWFHAPAEVPFADPRLWLGEICFFVLLAALLYRRGQLVAQKPLVGSLLVMVAVSYVSWLWVYSILRYIILLEALSGILMVLAIRHWCSREVALVACTLLAIGTWGLTTFPEWGRSGFTKQLIHFYSFPKIPSNSMVVFYGNPLSFLAPFFPKDTTFVGGLKYPPAEMYPKELQQDAKKRNALPGVYYEHRLTSQIKQKIAAFEGPVYVVGVAGAVLSDPISLTPYGMRAIPGSCNTFSAELTFSLKRWEICEVEKIATSF